MRIHSIGAGNSSHWPGRESRLSGACPTSVSLVVDAPGRQRDCLDQGSRVGTSAGSRNLGALATTGEWRALGPYQIPAWIALQDRHKSWTTSQYRIPLLADEMRHGSAEARNRINEEVQGRKWVCCGWSCIGACRLRIGRVGRATLCSVLNGCGIGYV